MAQCFTRNFSSRLTLPYNHPLILKIVILKFKQQRNEKDFMTKNLKFMLIMLHFLRKSIGFFPENSVTHWEHVCVRDCTPQ